MRKLPLGASTETRPPGGFFVSGGRRSRGQAGQRTTAAGGVERHASHSDPPIIPTFTEIPAQRRASGCPSFPWGRQPRPFPNSLPHAKADMWGKCHGT